MLLKQKKAILFNISLVIITALVLGTALFTLSPAFLHQKPIGLKQFELIETYQEGEKVLFSAEQSAKYASYDSIYSLADSGGFFNENKCGKFQDYAFWQTAQKDIDDCFPEYKNNFEDHFIINLKKYFLTNEDLKQMSSDLDYSLNLDANKDRLGVIGISYKYLHFPYIDKQKYLDKLTQQEKNCLAQTNHISIFENGLLKDCKICPNVANCLDEYDKTYCNYDYRNYVDENYCNIDPCNYNSYWKNDKCVLNTIDYSIKPNFNVKIPYDLDVYERIKQGAKNLLNACASESTAALKRCIEKTIPGFGGQSWKIASFNDRIFAFDLDAGTMLPLYDDRIVYKIAIYFSIPTPQQPTSPTTPLTIV